MPRYPAAQNKILFTILALLMLLSLPSFLPVSVQAQSNVSLVISSVDSGNNPISGYYVVLSQSGNVVSTGFTPATFSLASGATYSVQADGYGSCAFSNWQDTGSTNAIRQVSITTNTQLTAVYNCKGSSPSSVAVSSVNQNGNAISGYYVALSSSSGSIVGTGFTPKTFSTNSGQSYSLVADGYKACAFAQWSDGVTADPRTITSTSGGMTFTAIYDCGTGQGGSSSVKINSINQNGTSISGFYTVLYSSSGGVLGTGFTPATFPTTSGSAYSVRAESYGNCIFANWTTGSTNDPMTFIATSTAQSFTAVYNCGNGVVGNSNGITVTANRIPASYWAPCFALVCSRGTGPGASMYVVLYNSTGSVVATGFADEHGLVFKGLNPSATYYVYPDDCDLCHGSTHDVLFQYWGGINPGNATSTVRPLPVKVGDVVNAWYNCTNGCGGT